MSNNYGPKIVTDGLVLCLDAADRNSHSGENLSSTWTNLVTRDNYTITGSKSFLNQNGGILDFDGTDDYVTTNFNITGSINFTFSCWVKLDRVNLSTQVVADNSSGATGFGIRIAGIYYSPFGYGVEGATALVLTSSLPLNTSDWYNIVTVYTPNRIDSYINLYHEYVTGTMSSVKEDISNDMKIGTRTDAFDNDFDGKISMISVYSKALSANEVQQNYNATKGRFGL